MERFIIRLRNSGIINWKTGSSRKTGRGKMVLRIIMIYMNVQRLGLEVETSRRQIMKRSVFILLIAAELLWRCCKMAVWMH